MTAVTWAFFGVMAAVLLRPLFNAHRTEIWRLCQVLADLPEVRGWVVCESGAVVVDVAGAVVVDVAGAMLCGRVH